MEHDPDDLQAKKNKKSQENRQAMNAFSLVSQLGLIMFVSIALSLFIGNWLDNTFDTSPIFIMIFIFLGLGTAFRNMYFLVMKPFGNKKK